MAFNRFQKMVEERQDKSEESAKATVMVVDDDLSIRDALSFVLKKKFDTIVCASGQEGVKLVDETVSCIVLDIKMPGMDGFQVYDIIKKRFPDIPIIFYSAFQDIMESVEFKRKYQPFGYFDKSGNTDGLFKSIDHAVQRRELLLKLKKEKERASQK